MEKSRKRTLRRHHRARLKAARRICYGGLALAGDDRQKARLLGMFVHTMPACSCTLCGNPRRRHGRITLAERRFEEFACVRSSEEE